MVGGQFDAARPGGEAGDGDHGQGRERGDSDYLHDIHLLGSLLSVEWLCVLPVRGLSGRSIGLGKCREGYILLTQWENA